MIKEVDHGENVRIWRTIMGLKQDALGRKLGYSEKSAQNIVSELEHKSTIDKETLQNIADALDIPVEVLENYSTKDIIIILKAFNDNAINQGAIIAYNPTFNYNGKEFSKETVNAITNDVVNNVIQHLKEQSEKKKGE